jgi:hypothetical protein
MMSEAIRPHHQISQRQWDQTQAHELSPLNDSAPYRSGILIFSRRQKLLHVDPQALELIGHPDQPQSEPNSQIHVTPVCELLNAIQAALDHRKAVSIWEPFELKRVIFERTRKIVVRGLGLIDRDSYDDSRIVIALDEVRLRQEHRESQEQMIGLSPERGGAGILGSAHLGSAHGVFDT